MSLDVAYISYNYLNFPYPILHSVIQSGRNPKCFPINHHNLQSCKPNKSAETLLLACVREVPNSNTGSKPDCYCSSTSYDYYSVRAPNAENVSQNVSQNCTLSTCSSEHCATCYDFGTLLTSLKNTGFQVKNFNFNYVICELCKCVQNYSRYKTISASSLSFPGWLLITFTEIIAENTQQSSVLLTHLLQKLVKR
jgi:hypothetical protein